MFGGVNPMYANQPQAAVLTGGVGPPAPPQGGSSVDPALMQMVLQQQMAGPEDERIKRQMKLAEALRGDGTQGLQGIQAGRRYVAPGAANLIGNIGQSFMGAFQGQQAEGAAAKQGAANSQALGGVLDYLKGSKRDPRASSLGGGGSGYGGEY